MSSRWTKRRKVNAEKAEILNSCLQVGTASQASVYATDSSSSDSFCCFSTNSHVSAQHCENLNQLASVDVSQSIGTNLLSEELETSSISLCLADNLCELPSDQSGNQHDESYSTCSQELQNNAETTNLESASESESVYSEEEETKTPRAMIAALKHQFNLSHTAVEAIAAMLTKLGHKVPKSAKAILGTTRVPLDDKTFIHFKLKEGIVRAIRHSPIKDSSGCLSLQISIDGIPIFNSSGKSFWPILCRITNARNKSPFSVSVYYGDGKPEDLDKFLDPFISEYILLKRDGITIEGVQYKVKIACVICDAQARFYVKHVKPANAYAACERCEQIGQRILKRLTFLEFDAGLRTNERFRSKSNKRHHNLDQGISPFEKIDDLDMIYHFPLDYMHLVLLGVMKRMINKIWRGKLPHCFSAQQIKIINYDIEKCKHRLPREFKRKGQPLDFVRFYYIRGL